MDQGRREFPRRDAGKTGPQTHYFGNQVWYHQPMNIAAYPCTETETTGTVPLATSSSAARWSSFSRVNSLPGTKPWVWNTSRTLHVRDGLQRGSCQTDSSIHTSGKGAKNSASLFPGVGTRQLESVELHGDEV